MNFGGDRFDILNLCCCTCHPNNYGTIIVSFTGTSSLENQLVKNTCKALQKLKKMSLQRTVRVCRMGIVNYADALKIQEKLLSDRKTNKIPDTIISLQHPPTYTVGKRRTHHNLLVPESDLKAMGAELHHSERGGDITFHGPRQAIIYPIISLRDVGFGARHYVETLELAMIELCSMYGLNGRRGGVKGETGVWLGEKKIGAIGVRISMGIASHGLAFNIDPDLNFFKYIVPCGIADKGVTSLRRETSMDLPTDEIIQEQLVQVLARLLHYGNIV